MRSIVNPAQLIDLVSLLQIDFLEIHRMKTSANSEKMRWWNWLAIVVVAELLGVSEAMTPAEQTEIVVKHNELRRLAKASNMEHMVSSVTFCFSHFYYIRRRETMVVHCFFDINSLGK